MKEKLAPVRESLQFIHPRNLKHLTFYLEGLVRGRLWLQIIIGMLLGLAVGYLYGPEVGLVGRQTAETIGSWLAIPGRVFLTLLQMIVVPLIFASIIRGIAANENVGQLRSVGIRLVVYFLLTTTVAVSLGIATASVMQPGKYVENPPAAAKVSGSEVKEELKGDTVSLASIPESVVSVLPKNPINAAVETNLLQIVLFSVVIGLALLSLQPKQSKPLLDVLGSLQSVSMAVVKWTMLLAPLAVFGLMAQVTIQTGISTLLGVGMYVVTVIVGLFLMLCVYMALAFFFGNFTPWQFLSHVKGVMLLAFSTGSSAAVMPMTIKTVEEKLRVRPSISQFVVPIGATVNMDATALFQGIATVFLTQVYGLELSIGLMIALVMTVIGSSIGAPATPGVGIVILSVVLKGVGVPAEGITLIIGVDRILEMMRTSINVTGDMAASIVMDRFARMKRSLDEEEADEDRFEQKRLALGDDVIVDEEYSSQPQPSPA
jgi:Na+/H+-dicarboxylate symporter